MLVCTATPPLHCSQMHAHVDHDLTWLAQNLLQNANCMFSLFICSPSCSTHSSSPLLPPSCCRPPLPQVPLLGIRLCAVLLCGSPWHSELSLNVRGLHAPGKRHNLYRELDRLRGDIVFLQETHLTHTTSVKLFSPQYPVWYYSLSEIHKAKGVAIGFRGGVSFKMESMLSDPTGRFLFLRGNPGGMLCTLAILYAPNRDQASFIASTLKKLRNFARSCVILAGDFNTPLEPSIDTSQGKSCISQKRLLYIRRRLFDSQLMDVWRITHPKERDYTHYSQIHHSYSRIDLFFIDHHHLSLVIKAEIETSPIADQAPITLKLTIPSMPRRITNWKLNDTLNNEDIDKKMIGEELNLYFKENTHPDTSPGVLWEAHKAHIRGKLIELGSRKKREYTHQQMELIQDISVLEQQHKANQAQAVLHTLTLKREELKALLHMEHKRHARVVAQRFHEWGNKPGRLLARSLQQKKNASFIDEIKKISSDHLVHETSAIAKEFQTFYQHLYHVQNMVTDRETRKTLIHDYLSQANLLKLPSDTLDALEGEFTASEFRIALKAMAKGKAPGPDGFTVSYYRTFADILLPRLTSYANANSAGETLRPETLHVHITVIPKSGKDPSNCGSYRPISLLNLDAKLYAKVMANRLMPLIPRWVSTDQTGFIPGREV